MARMCRQMPDTQRNQRFLTCYEYHDDDDDDDDESSRRNQCVRMWAQVSDEILIVSLFFFLPSAFYLFFG